MPAAAQEIDSQISTAGSTYHNETAEAMKRAQQESMQSKGFIKPTTLNVSLVRYDYMEDDNFGIQMVVPDVVSGCWEFSPIEYEFTFIDPYYFDVKVKHYQRKPIEVENINGDCPAGNGQRHYRTEQEADWKNARSGKSVFLPAA